MRNHPSSLGRRALALTAALATAGLLAACASAAPSDDQKEDEAPTQEVLDVRLSLDWSTYVAYHAPFAIAAEQGIWEKHGLNVTETLPGGSGDAVLEVGTGKTDIAWADLSTSAASMLQEVPITAVAKVQEKNASGITVLAGTTFKSAKDLVGLRIGSTPGGSDATLIGAFLNANGIADQVEIVSMPANGKFAALMTGDVDAISGQVYFYVSNAKAEGKDAFGISYSDMGLNVLDHGFVANDSFIASNPEAITRFLAAYQEALAITIKNPAAACKILADKSDGAVIQESCETQLDLWLPLVTDPGSSSWGENSLDEWKTTVDVLVQYGGSTGTREPATMFTNDFLPGN